MTMRSILWRAIAIVLLSTPSAADWDRANRDLLITVGLNKSALMLFCVTNPAFPKGVYLSFGPSKELLQAANLAGGSDISFRVGTTAWQAPLTSTLKNDFFFRSPPNALIEDLRSNSIVEVISGGKIVDVFGISNPKPMQIFISDCNSRISSAEINTSHWSSRVDNSAREPLLAGDSWDNAEAFGNNPTVQLLSHLSETPLRKEVKAELASNFVVVNGMRVILAESDEPYIFSSDGKTFVSSGFLRGLLVHLLSASDLRLADLDEWLTMLRSGQADRLEYALRRASLGNDSIAAMQKPAMEFLKTGQISASPVNVVGKLNLTFVRFGGATSLIGAHELAHIRSSRAIVDCVAFQEEEFAADAFAVKLMVGFSKQMGTFKLLN